MSLAKKSFSKIISIATAIVVIIAILSFSILGVSANSATSVLGAASQFNVFIFNNADLSSSTEGRVAVGNKATVINAGLATSASSTGVNMVIGKEFVVTGGGSLKGTYAAGETASDTPILTLPQYSSFNRATGVYASTLSDFTSNGVSTFAEAKSQLVAISQQFYAANTVAGVGLGDVSIENPWNKVLALTYTGDASTVVFYISEALITDAVQLSFKINVPSGTPDIIVNIAGSNIKWPSWQQQYSGQSLSNVSSHIVFNLPDATSINTNSAAIYGSILAPKATFTTNGGNLSGTLVAENLKMPGGFGFHSSTLAILPLVPEEPSSSSETTPSSQPVSSSESSSSSESISSSESAVSSDPASSSEPAVSSTPVSSSEPAVPDDPASSSEPAVSSTPASSSEPAVSSTPVSSSEPAVSSTPVSSSESVTSTPSSIASSEASSSSIHSAAPQIGSSVPASSSAVQSSTATSAAASATSSTGTPVITSGAIPTGTTTSTAGSSSSLVVAGLTTPSSSSSTSATSGSASIQDDGTRVVSASEIVTLPNQETPLANLNETNSSWALLNLLLVVLSVAVSVILVIATFAKKAKVEKANINSHIHYSDDEHPTTDKQTLLWRVLGIAASIVSIIFFLLTENTQLPMAFIDKWTVWMILITVAQLAFVLLASRSKSKTYAEEDE
ncbi:MAG: collagen-binding domain-containing protein [Oscillospiraceae bacterium]